MKEEKPNVEGKSCRFDNARSKGKIKIIKKKAGDKKKDVVVMSEKATINVGWSQVLAALGICQKKTN